MSTLTLIENLNTLTPEHRREAFSRIVDHFFEILQRNAISIFYKYGISSKILADRRITPDTLLDTAYISLERHLTAHPEYVLADKNHLLALFSQHMYWALKTFQRPTPGPQTVPIDDNTQVAQLNDQDNLDCLINFIDSLSCEPYVPGNALTPTILFLRRLFLGEKFGEIADAYNLSYNKIRDWYTAIIEYLKEQFSEHGIPILSNYRPRIQNINEETVQLFMENNLDFRVGDFIQLFNDTPFDGDYPLLCHIKDLIEHNNESPENAFDCKIVLNDNRDDDDSPARILTIPHTLLEAVLNGITFTTGEFF